MLQDDAEQAELQWFNLEKHKEPNAGETFHQS
jgi:hypothetical protein